ncbi:MAG: methyltransferase domain-containing protein [Roseivirga sp.]
MSKNNTPRVIVMTTLGVIIVSLIYFVWMRGNRQTPEKLAKKLETIYADISGFGIASAEADYIREQGGAPTYGEIVYSSMDEVLKRLKVKSQDVFYDLGCGVGKFVLYTHLATRTKKSVGIELSESRFKGAQKAKERAQVAGLMDSNRQVSFVHEDIIQADLSDATIIFMCSTCFSETLMQNLVDNFLTLKPGLQIVTLKQLPEHARLQHVEGTNFPTSWSGNSPFHFYKLLPESAAQ